MNKKEALKIFKEYKQKYNAYYYLLGVAQYDSETIAPRKGSDKRNECISYMYGEAFKIQTDPELLKAIELLSKLDLGQQLDREIELTRRDLENVIKFSREEQMAYTLTTMNACDAWQKAKHDNNYKLFESHLIKVIDITKQRAIKRNPNKNTYDVLLDDYEQGMDIKQYDVFFDLIKKELLPLIKEVDNKKDYIDDSFIYKYYPIDRQKKFMEELLHFLRFDQEWSYMGISEHPFTIDLLENDIRITTAYNEHNITSCLFSIIHEVGHAYYMHQVDHKYQGTLLSSAISSGMHESQSRFLENYLGRRKSFWTTLYPKLQKAFPENLKDVTLDQFYKAVNTSKCSLIRTDADELTYPIHILIRYEIEKGLFDGSISTDNLNLTWNKKYKEYLSIDVASDSEGIMQDIHWSQGSFGYFPTYALGSAIGAQLMHHMSKELDVDGLLEKGKFSEITKYLKNKLQKYGALYNYNDLLKLCINEPFKPKYYIDYLTKKYKKLYDIK